jgi:hypothetical protein
MKTQPRRALNLQLFWDVSSLCGTGILASFRPKVRDPASFQQTCLEKYKLFD